MAWKTGERVDSTRRDNLIAKLSPKPDSFIIELKTPGVYKRGTVLTLESNGKYEVLGVGKGVADAILADDTEAEDESAVAYRKGHFNRNALICGTAKAAKENEEGTPYAMTAKDENDLRRAGIFLSDAV